MSALNKKVFLLPERGRYLRRSLVLLAIIIFQTQHFKSVELWQYSPIIGAYYYRAWCGRVNCHQGLTFPQVAVGWRQ